jgi:hypothetical protein
MVPQSTVQNTFPPIAADSTSYLRMRVNGATRRAAATEWDTGKGPSRSEPPAFRGPG